ncbi:MAG: anaerobic ribonucleoside-triphosphate reductase activating protein, partial [Oscillospiraceae bacterium]|nr:anaerobic ribonucleoside-triphosphate reductase activating protein [Oscillospiraceae bacterium]
MRIHGLQKMTLLDFPGHVACTVFLGGCDFRCPFCHNYELIDGSAQPVMDADELLAFLAKRKGLLDGVAVTGGEPCLHSQLPELLEAIRALGFSTKLDTNGYHPAMLRELLERSLVDYVAMDVKNSPEKYAMTCGVPAVDLSPIRESIDLLRHGNADYEFRTTVVRELHEEADFAEIGKMIAGAKRYFL